MKGRITKLGILEMERGPNYKMQRCVNIDYHACIDECPQFGEPYTTSGIHRLDICQKRTLKFMEFEDLRGE